MILGLLLFTLGILTGSAALAEVSVPGIFSDHMVLQRNEPLPIWGFADPGEKVTVAIAGQQIATIADDAGNWRVELDALKAGGPHRLKIKGNNTISIDDVYVGEVWLCSGQSNMEWRVASANNAEAEMAAADLPMIRMYTAERTLSATPQPNVAGQWQVCTPDNVGHFSAVGYFFGRSLYKELDVPIGLVHSSWGGSRAEPWTPREALLTNPRYTEQIKEVDRQVAAMLKNKDQAIADYEEAMKVYRKALILWVHDINNGGTGLKEDWASAEGDDNDWHPAVVPGAWEAWSDGELTSFDGVVWFTRTVDIPEAWAGKNLALHLGAIDDLDKTFFNGEEVGSTGLDVPWHWTTERKYAVPGELVSAGKATLTVRIIDTGGAGGFNGPAEQMTLAPLDDENAQPIKLDGEGWRYRVDFSMAKSPRPTEPADPTQAGATFSTPAAMYNAMLHPLVPYGLRGAIWYQGESNAGESEAYRELLPLMIQGWRDVWHKPDMPFGIVQLANYMNATDKPNEGGWAFLRDAQLHTFKTVDNTGLAVIIDIGQADDIHPRNKQDVGDRLARWALSQVYGKSLVWSGPIYKTMQIKDGKIYLDFDHVGSGLKTSDGKPVGGFAIAGEDGQYVWADARIEGDQVVVWSDSIKEPVSVRYGWANNPDRVNLINAEGLPASPFRTDE